MHNIGYMDVKDGTKPSVVVADIVEMAEVEGDGYDTCQLKWHMNIPPFESRDEALEWITRNDNGWYDDHAVRYKRYAPAKKTKKIEAYKKKMAELWQGKREYEREHSVKKLQAKLITCPHCSSKLSREFLRGERCPLCGTDLRSKTVLDKLRWFDEKREYYASLIAEEEAKQQRGYEIYWLVKYEFHS